MTSYFNHVPLKRLCEVTNVSREDVICSVISPEKLGEHKTVVEPRGMITERPNLFEK